jgi:hypothetical protein
MRHMGITLVVADGSITIIYKLDKFTLILNNW